MEHGPRRGSANFMLLLVPTYAPKYVMQRVWMPYSNNSIVTHQVSGFSQIYSMKQRARDLARLICKLVAEPLTRVNFYKGPQQGSTGDI